MNSFILAALCASALFSVSNAVPAAANACGLLSAVGGTDAFNGVMKQCGGPNCNLGDALGCAQVVPQCASWTADADTAQMCLACSVSFL